MPEVYWGLHICALAEVNINYYKSPSKKLYKNWGMIMHSWKGFTYKVLFFFHGWCPSTVQNGDTLVLYASLLWYAKSRILPARKQWVLMTQLVFQKLLQPSSRPHLLLIVNDQLQLAPQVPYLPFLFLVNEVKLKDKHLEKTRRGKEKQDTTEKNYNICNEIYNIRRWPDTSNYFNS